MKTALIFLLLSFACSQPPRLYRITATELAQEYRDNPVAGAEKYTTRPYRDIDLIITGKVSRIRMVPFVNMPTVELIVQDSTAPGVVIYFAQGEIRRIARLKKDQRITVKGRCVGIVYNKLRINSGKSPWQNANQTNNGEYN